MATITSVQGYTATQPGIIAPIAVLLSSLASRYNPAVYTSTASQLPILFPTVNSLSYYRTVENYTNLLSSIYNINIDIDRVGLRNNFAYNGASIYLNGTSGIYIQDPSTLYSFGTNSTLEAWVRLTSMPNSGTSYGIFSKRNNTSITPANWITLELTDAGLLKLQVSTSNTNPGWDLTVTGSTSLTEDTWYHIALVKSSDTWTVYLNGKVYSTGSSTGTVRDTTSTLAIGSLTTTGTYSLRGYVAGIRFINSTAVYSTTFTTAYYQPTAITGTVLLINPTFSTNTVTDTSGYTPTITGTYITNGYSPFELNAKYADGGYLGVLSAPGYASIQTLNPSTTTIATVTELWI